MASELLPASAAAFAPPASSVIVVFDSKVAPWITLTLKRIKKPKDRRPLNSVWQQEIYLTEILSSPNAIWALASLLLPKAPKSELTKDISPLECEFIHVEAYIVHVDMVMRNEVAYKLTPGTINSLTKYHKNIHCVDAKASVDDWPEKDQQCNKLHEDFVKAINNFVFKTHAKTLEELEEDGTGELVGEASEVVKNNIMCLFKPLLPPPPKIIAGHAPIYGLTDITRENCDGGVVAGYVKPGKAFQCDWLNCGRSYCRIEHLKRHVRTHHLKEPNKPRRNSAASNSKTTFSGAAVVEYTKEGAQRGGGEVETDIMPPLPQSTIPAAHEYLGGNLPYSLDSPFTWAYPGAFHWAMEMSEIESPAATAPISDVPLLGIVPSTWYGCWPA